MATAIETSLEASPPVEVRRRRVVVCGSFRRDPAGLSAAVAGLEEHFDVLSPRGTDFINPGAEFVRLPGEELAPAWEIERAHLDAIEQADFVWLFAPDGYVGRSAALEVGHANAVGVPVFTDAVITDEVLRGCVHIVAAPGSIDRAALRDKGASGRGVGRLQRYYAETAHRRGWDSEGPDQTLLLMLEEVGELSRAMRKGGSTPSATARREIGFELADVQLYLVHLANALGLDLADAVSAKERINAKRFPEVK
ncbi:MazG nucleotide pyrophosphohydrolase domain-containing protein [Demequina sp.]|uniref:MazG nucleotide pyrophosphohydrolase domain-containing protein n=1 Tax=Demequina sp. TaxID=2050685 RepID=UPI003D0DDC6E